MNLPGHAWRDLEKLCPCARERYERVSTLCSNNGNALRVIETLRDVERQRHYVSIGASQTMFSRHLPQTPNELSLAIDAAPVEYLGLKHWNPNGPKWAELGKAAKGAGLLWGGDWLSFVDKPHLYLGACLCEVAA